MMKIKTVYQISYFPVQIEENKKIRLPERFAEVGAPSKARARKIFLSSHENAVINKCSWKRYDIKFISDETTRY